MMRTATVIITLLMLTGCGGSAAEKQTQAGLMEKTGDAAIGLVEKFHKPKELDILDCAKVDKGAVENTENSGLSFGFDFPFFGKHEMNIGGKQIRKQDCNDYSGKQSKKPSGRVGRSNDYCGVDDFDYESASTEQINAFKERCYAICHLKTGYFYKCLGN